MSEEQEVFAGNKMVVPEEGWGGYDRKSYEDILRYNFASTRIALLKEDTLLGRPQVTVSEPYQHSDGRTVLKVGWMAKRLDDIPDAVDLALHQYAAPAYRDELTFPEED